MISHFYLHVLKTWGLDLADDSDMTWHVNNVLIYIIEGFDNCQNKILHFDLHILLKVLAAALRRFCLKGNTLISTCCWRFPQPPGKDSAQGGPGCGPCKWRQPDSDQHSVRHQHSAAAQAQATARLWHQCHHLQRWYKWWVRCRQLVVLSCLFFLFSFFLVGSIFLSLVTILHLVHYSFFCMQLCLLGVGKYRSA